MFEPCLDSGLRRNDETKVVYPSPLSRLCIEPESGLSGANRSSSAADYVVCSLPGRVAQAAPDEALRQRIQAAGGVFCFGYFPLDKQRKVTRLSGESDINLGTVTYAT